MIKESFKCRAPNGGMASQGSRSNRCSLLRCKSASGISTRPGSVEPPFYKNSILDDEASTSDPSKFVKQRPETYTALSMRDTGTLRPGPEWYPAWMKYRRREANYVFWQEKFSRCSIDVPGRCGLCYLLGTWRGPIRATGILLTMEFVLNSDTPLMNYDRCGEALDNLLDDLVHNG